MKEAGGWRYVYASIPGVAHRASGADCQDACAVQWLEAPDTPPALALAAADGAGSAAEARAGAELACQTLLAECAAQLAQAPGADWARTAAETLIERVQAALSQRAAETGLPVREFACTLLGAVLAEDWALFLQIGDGAIVIGAGDDYRPVFWPQAGEYANETYFVTDDGAATRLEFAALAEPVGEIALLTDGLQALALHYQTRQAHAPFFRPLFQRLRAVPEPGCPPDLQAALARFLDAPALNQRTHDDKTLILATRQPVAPIESVAASPAESSETTDSAPADVPARPDPPPLAAQEARGDEAV
ncbi:MAG: PP2C family serine/threonine-protein phosphatase [Candidatus Contendobacter sp.]|nr:PP2C family serine/threonine-protein phosphatase [Candidatus Contendobacter sp.]